MQENDSLGAKPQLKMNVTLTLERAPGASPPPSESNSAGEAHALPAEASSSIVD